MKKTEKMSDIHAEEDELQGLLGYVSEDTGCAVVGCENSVEDALILMKVNGDEHAVKVCERHWDTMLSVISHSGGDHTAAREQSTDEGERFENGWNLMKDMRIEDPADRVQWNGETEKAHQPEDDAPPLKFFASITTTEGNHNHYQVDYKAD